MKNVSLRSCDTYKYEEVKLQIDKLINDLGGLEKYIHRNSTVFIKLNLVIKKNPNEMATTHPMILKVIAEKLLKLGCKIIVGDSPGGPYTKSSLKALYKTCGIEEVCEELNIDLNYDTSEIKVENTDGKILKYITVIEPITKVDHVVNICKLKTHAMATFTGGVKNLINLDQNTVPTIQRCIERSFIEKDFSDINVIVEKVEDNIINDFKIPKNRSISFLRGKVPKDIEIFVNKNLAGKPVINYKECVKCGECSRVIV